ncbi:DNA polymerase III subunit delta [Spongorhabdus nitratireducens]
MILKPEKLEEHLRGKLQPVYLVSGDEPLLVQECCDQIRQAARQQGYDERQLLQVEQGFDWSRLQDANNSLSLFSQQQLIELRLDNLKLGEGGKVLESCLQNPSPDNLLLIIAPRIDGATKKSRWFKAVDKDGVHIALWPVELSRLPGWIGNRMKAAGLRPTPEAVKMLSERVEGNLLAASQEIEKLRLLSENGEVSVELIQEAISNSARYDVFSLVDAVVSSNAALSVRVLNGLRSEGVEPTIVLWALARELRMLSQLARLLGQNIKLDAALEQVAKLQKLPPFPLKKRKNQLRDAIYRTSEHTLRDLISRAARIDNVLKGAEPGDPWSLILGLVMSLCGVHLPEEPHLVNF